MDDLKIIFYILVAIAWIVYKNYQKVKTNRPHTHPAVPEESTSDEFEESYRKAAEEIKPKLPERKTPQRVPPTKARSFAVRGTQPQLLDAETAPVAAFFRDELKNLAQGAMPSKPAVAIEPEVQAWRFNPNEINLKQAFIYSVILQRPAY